MRSEIHPGLERGRIVEGPLASEHGSGNEGAFLIPSPQGGDMLVIVASDGRDWAETSLQGEPWEHVSVHVSGKLGRALTRTPTWKEMCYVKDLFWPPEECVLQFHPAESQYVNVHNTTLHLWRPTRTPIAMPPQVCV